MYFYKYLSEESHTRSLINEGHIFMRPLSYFRAHEDKLVRGDPHDAKLQYEPEGGLVVRKNGEIVQLPPGLRFCASVRADEIFVYCMSAELSSEIAAKFECPFCVEIHDPIRLVGRLKRHVRLRSKFEPDLFSRRVDYRNATASPNADWALPERVAFMKIDEFAWQKEHRIVIGRRGAFAIENVELTLESGDAEFTPSPPTQGPLSFYIGNISQITKLHRF